MSDTAKKLLFSIDKEIASPDSKAGKVWRVLIKSGVLHVADKIIITSVNLAGRSKTDYFCIEAAIKSIHEELDTLEGVKESSAAPTGSIVGVDLKNCYFDRKKCHKRDISITTQSIGFGAEESFAHYDEFYIKFVDAGKAFDVVTVGQNIVLLWFGKSVSARVIQLPDSIEGMYVKILYGRNLTIPCDPEIRRFMKKIIIRAEQRGRFWYFSGLFEFDGSN